MWAARHVPLETPWQAPSFLLQRTTLEQLLHRRVIVSTSCRPLRELGIEDRHVASLGLSGVMLFRTPARSPLYLEAARGGYYRPVNNTVGRLQYCRRRSLTEVETHCGSGSETLNGADDLVRDPDDSHMVDRLERRTVQVQVVVLVMDRLVEPLEHTVIKVAMVAQPLLGILVVAAAAVLVWRRQTRQVRLGLLAVLELRQV